MTASEIASRLKTLASIDWARPVQVKEDGEWRMFMGNVENAEHWHILKADDWRNKPVTQRVPYTFETFPWPKQRTLVRMSENPEMVWEVNALEFDETYGGFVSYGQDEYDSFEALSVGRELSLDGGATWQPCSQEVSDEGGTK